MRILDLKSLKELSTEELNLLRKAQQSGTIHISCEAEEMTQVVHKKFKITCYTDFALPCSVLPNEPIRSRENASELRVGILGAPRTEKGRKRFSGIIKSLIEKKRSRQIDTPVTVVTQSVPLRAHPRTVYKSTPLLFAKYTQRAVNVEILWGTQTNEEYRNALFDLDCVLLPYTLERYATSGSGMILDAVNAGIPIVRSAGMAMSSYVAYGNCIDAVSDDDFAHAILDIASKRDQFKIGAQKARAAMSDRMANLPFL